MISSGLPVRHMRAGGATQPLPREPIADRRSADRAVAARCRQHRFVEPGIADARQRARISVAHDVGAAMCIADRRRATCTCAASTPGSAVDISTDILFGSGVARLSVPARRSAAAAGRRAQDLSRMRSGSKATPTTAASTPRHFPPTGSCRRRAPPAWCTCSWIAASRPAPGGGRLRRVSADDAQHHGDRPQRQPAGGSADHSQRDSAEQGCTAMSGWHGFCS